MSRAQLLDENEIFAIVEDVERLQLIALNCLQNSWYEKHGLRGMQLGKLHTRVAELFLVELIASNSRMPSALDDSFSL